MRTLISIPLLLLLSACSPASLQLELENKLNDAGYFSMSDTNQYTAVNTVIEHYAQSAPELKGFLENEGTPDAVKYKKTVLGPRRFFLAYAQPPRLFVAKQIETGWMITGPDPLPPSVTIPPVERPKKNVSTKKKPVLSLKATPSPTATPQPSVSTPTQTSPSASPTPSSTPTPISPSPSVRAPNPPPLPRSTPTPLVTPTLSAGREVNSQATSSAAETRKRTAGVHPMTTAQLLEVRMLVAELGKKPAKLSPKGDVTYVVLGQQPFAAISLWHTMDRSAESLVRRINKVPVDQLQVSAGTIISVPGYLVKNNLQYEPEFAARCSLFKD